METQAIEYNLFTQANLSAPTFENFWNGTLVQMPRKPIDQVNDQVKIGQLAENERKVFFFIKNSDQVNDQLTTGYIARKLDLSYSTIQRIRFFSFRKEPLSKYCRRRAICRWKSLSSKRR